MDFITDFFTDMHQYDTQTKVYTLLGFVTFFILIWFGVTYFIQKKFGKNAKLKAIPNGLTIKVDHPEYQAGIAELLKQHGLEHAQEHVSRAIKQKVARMNTALLRMRPKEIVETFYTGQIDECKRILLENVLQSENKWDYFWAVADICFIQLDFNTALFYMDQAIQDDPANKDLKKDMLDLIELWESRSQAEAPQAG